MGTIVFVHGTGVRLKSYLSGFQNAKKVATAAGIKHDFVACAWGDPLGIEFEGKSLPDPPTPQRLEEDARELAQWNWLFDDPLFELYQLTIRDPKAPRQIPRPGVKPAWVKLWDEIAAYKPSQELQILLERGGLERFWPAAWSDTIDLSAIPRQAFEASAHELAEASHALARALIAQLHVLAMAAGSPGPSRSLRNSLRQRLLQDWKQTVYGLGTFFANMLKRVATSIVRSHRYNISDTISLPIGDVLLYQAHGPKVRDFIRQKVERAIPPVTLVAHSLGGIACVDLLALPNPPNVKYLITAGSQSPLLCEIGALISLTPNSPLPSGFPPWLNFYDRNDFLSYIGSRIWPAVVDKEVESGQPFPDSHSAYFGMEEVWSLIHNFIK
jgi:hypothetical protein